MKVILKDGWTQSYPELTGGNRYRVIGIENDHFRIIDDSGEPTLFNPNAFDIADKALPADWISKRGEEGELYAYPPDLLEPPCFFEKFFDDDQEVRSKFQAYMVRLCHEERTLIPPPPNEFRRILDIRSNEEKPTICYVEVDADGSEVRKVEILGNGHLGYANARGSFGGTTLGRRIATDLHSDNESISRLEFEEVWDRALSFEESEQAKS